MRLFLLSLIVIVACKKSKEAPPAPSDPPKATDPAPTKSAPASKPATTVEAWCGATPCACESHRNHHGTDKLASCKLSKAAVVQGYPVKPGSEGGELMFSDTGRLVYFALDKDFDIHGYPVRGRTVVQLFSDGALKYIAQLRESREIQGLPCTSFTLYPGGKLRHCYLGADTTVAGHAMKTKDRVWLDKDGKLHRWEISGRNEKLGAYECTGFTNAFHPTGELMRCGLASAQTIEGKPYEKAALVCFDTAGKVAECSKFRFDMGGD